MNDKILIYFWRVSHQRILAFYFRARSTVRARALKIVLRSLRRGRLIKFFHAPPKKGDVALRDRHQEKTYVLREIPIIFVC